MIIGIDFDGTIVEHEYPNIGAPVPGAIEKMKRWQEEGHKLILWTMRDAGPLLDAVEYLRRHGIELWGVNKNPDQHWTSSPKAYCNVYIDDAAYGCPLVYPDLNTRPYVDWSRIDFPQPIPGL